MLRYSDGDITLMQKFPIEVEDVLMRQPEARMWAVCLAQAIAGSVGLIRCHDLRRYQGRDRYWLIRDRRHVVGSCSWICELLGIDRARLIKFVVSNRHVLRKHPYRLRSFC